MSKPKRRRTNRSASRVESDVGTPPDALTAPMGPQILELLEVAYRARLPMLVEGPTGVGKSQIVAEFADRARIDFAVLDLSLLEPPDLVGLPIIADGRTEYAAPAELPRSGRGILMLEELNRAEIPVMQPALQLLSARRLHAYELPPGWSCVAAVNPEDGDYQVHRLDPALRSRFLQVQVRADRDTWLPWAERNNVHPVIRQLVAAHADAFDHASPRSWTYASDVILAMGPAELQNADLVRLALRGFLPTAWSLRAVEALAEMPTAPKLDLAAVFAPGGLRELEAALDGLQASGRTDVVTLIATELRRAVNGPEFEAAVRDGDLDLEAIEVLFSPLPGDLRDQCLSDAVVSAAATRLLAAFGTTPDDIANGYADSQLRESVREWRDDMRLHRVRLVVDGACRWLQGTDRDGDLGPALPNLAALCGDAGVLADELEAGLRARGHTVESQQA